MPKALLAAILAALAIGSPSASPRAEGFVVDVDALGSFPVGTLEGGRRATDMMGTGYGVKAEVLYGVGTYLAAGLGVGGASHDADVLVGPLSVDADLIAVPVYALAQVRTARAAGLGFYAETGAGITAWNVKPHGAGADSRTQTTFMYLAGGGLSYLLTRRWDVRAGVQYQQAVTGHGEVWAEGDDPKFALLSLGAHFQR